jgi:hypothetical protein
VTDAEEAPVPVHHRYFAVLKEQHAMTQTAEPGIKGEHSESPRIRENGAQTNNTEGHAISDNSAHGQGEDMMSRA